MALWFVRRSTKILPKNNVVLDLRLVEFILPFFHEYTDTSETNPNEFVRRGDRWFAHYYQASFLHRFRMPDPRWTSPDNGANRLDHYPSKQRTMLVAIFHRAWRWESDQDLVTS